MWPWFFLQGITNYASLGESRTWSIVCRFFFLFLLTDSDITLGVANTNPLFNQKKQKKKGNCLCRLEAPCETCFAERGRGEHLNDATQPLCGLFKRERKKLEQAVSWGGRTSLRILIYSGHLVAFRARGSRGLTSPWSMSIRTPPPPLTFYPLCFSIPRTIEFRKFSSSSPLGYMSKIRLPPPQLLQRYCG